MSGRIAVLMTCHNRSEITLACLAKLLPLLGEKDRLYLVDDGSRDGTTETVVALNDARINVITGTGSLYWARGMRLAWETATKETDYDFYLWLNDDVVMKSDAIENLLKDYRATCSTNHQPLTTNNYSVIVGACSADESEETSSYAATDERDRQVFPNGKVPQRATGWFNGNCVLVPRATYEAVGMISGDYSHARADYDYAERLKRAGIPFFASSRFVGVCHNDYLKKLSGKSLWQRIQMFGKPGYWNLADLFRFRYRYWGLSRAVLSVCHLAFQVVFQPPRNRHLTV